MSLLIYKILNYEGSIKIRMTIDHGLILNDLFFKITTMAASVLLVSQQDSFRCHNRITTIKEPSLLRLPSYAPVVTGLL